MVHAERKKLSVSRSLFLTLILGAFALGIFIGAGTMGLTPSLQADKGEEFAAGREEEFRFIRTPIGPKEPGARRPSRELPPFRYKVDAAIEEKIRKGEASSISFYFRDLVNGNRFGIRENEKFSHNSFLKLPLMIAYFKWTETNPLVLRKTLMYQRTDQLPERKNIKPVAVIEPGRNYTVNDLIFRMIAYDDSAACALLSANLPPGRLQKVFKDLNTDYDPQNDGKEETISLSAFASFYRVLFNASYLSEEMSEKALRYLSKSTFRDGMASGVPQQVDIASKQGERVILVTSDDGDEEICQLHEFGIIYHADRPFLVGIVARGDDFPSLVKDVRDITRLVYEEVDQQSSS